MIEALVFYMFAFVTVASGVMVISSRNPVHSVLFLILAFFNAAGLFLLLGAEFLAMILVIVYVGAVAVLFLFVVMMLDINFVEIRQGFLHYLPIGGLIGVVLIAELLTVIGSRVMVPDAAEKGAAPMPSLEATANTNALGELIYTHYIYLFQAAGLILLVAMIGAIVLSHRSRKGVRRQNISDQIARRAEESVKTRKVESGRGI
ncbi:MAG: NADH:ubiquinone oxidoreductase subunit J [Rhodospirillales bacterium RIFCSPLOWO2_12_FULL_58_28]|nr:MAG: NADH:ubiquinone oxidoreductase subunit J [Rhodospirillales bacterium RIFCSPLOWO2_02_FULL_58_16]OHC79057.1 MAG: NADH:ubiquinone oxidoreductase subunit J [Rhodospirillales bacterium RIFCSPLOWO2_12_FULL_58_28]